MGHAELGLLAAAAKLAKAEGKNAKGRASSQFNDAVDKVGAAVSAALEAGPGPERRANVTDPQSRVMPTAHGGWVQGYNAQAVATGGQVILAVGVSANPNDVGELAPTLEEMNRNLTSVGVDPGEVGVLLADAGYWSEANATLDGPDRLIATQKDWRQRKAAQELGRTSGPPPQDATLTEQMEHRLRTPGGAAYRKRSGTIEPVFGQVKANQGIRRVARRGLDAARSELSFVGAVHNIKKLITHADGRRLTILLNPAN